MSIVYPTPNRTGCARRLALKSITPEDHVVLIEIGGNDLLISVPSDELERALDGLLSN
jgi:hypothetical protein